MATRLSPTADTLVTRSLSENQSTSATVLVALQDAGVDLADRGRLLADALDPDALDRLFAAPEAGDATVAVDLWGRRVVVDGQEVRVYDA